MKFWGTTLSLFFASVALSCGIPNPYKGVVNAPYWVESFSKNYQITLRVHSFNPSEVQGDILGYNVYFSYSNNISDILSREIYLEGDRTLPTISHAPKGNEDVLDIVLSNFSYGVTQSGSTNKQISRESLTPYTSYYFIVTPYLQSNTPTNNFFFVTRETTEYNELSRTVNLGDTLSFSPPCSETPCPHKLLKPILFTNNDYILGENGAVVQDMGYYHNFDDVKNAPLDGYSTIPLVLSLGHIYVYKDSDGFYGKILVKALSANTVTMDFSYQGKKGETEI